MLTRGFCCAALFRSPVLPELPMVLQFSSQCNVSYLAQYLCLLSVDCCFALKISKQAVVLFVVKMMSGSSSERDRAFF